MPDYAPGRALFHGPWTSRHAAKPVWPRVAKQQRGCTSAGNFNLFKGPEIGDFWGLGGPGGLGDPPERWGGFAPTFLKGFPGPRGRPDPQNDRFPILKQI